MTTPSNIDVISDEISSFVRAYPSNPEDQDLTQLYKFLTIFVQNNINQRLTLYRSLLVNKDQKIDKKLQADNIILLAKLLVRVAIQLQEDFPESDQKLKLVKCV